MLYSAGDISTCCWSGLSKSILALVCLSLGVFIALHILPVCIAFYVRFYFSASYSGLAGSLSVGWVFQEVKGPIPRLCVNHRNPRIEWEHGLSRGVRLGMDYVTTSRVVVSNGGIIVTRIRAVMMLTFGRTVYCVSRPYLGLDFTREWGGNQ